MRRSDGTQFVDCFCFRFASSDILCTWLSLMSWTEPVPENACAKLSKLGESCGLLNSLRDAMKPLQRDVKHAIVRMSVCVCVCVYVFVCVCRRIIKITKKLAQVLSIVYQRSKEQD